MIPLWLRPVSARWLALVALAAAGAAQAATRPVRVHAETLLDGRGAVLRDKTLVIEGSRIVALEAGRSGAIDHELGASTLMPGWIDTHIHLASHLNAAGRPEVAGQSTGEYFLRIGGTAWATLMAGFTTVQSVGDEADKVVRDAINEGVIPGPRVLTSLTGLNDRSGSPEEIRRKVRQLIASSADVIKIFATKSGDHGAQTMTDAQIEAACSEARIYSRRTVVHAFGDAGARAAVLAGGASIEHGAYLTDATLELMAVRGTCFDPNLAMFRNYLDHRALWAGDYTPADFAQMEKDYPLTLDTLRRALTKKVKVVFGTDAIAGAHGRNADEFIYRVRDAGQPPMDAIVSATSRAAEALGLQGKIGAIAVGLEADLVATDGNPLRDIESVRRVVFVMRAGVVYKATGLRPAAAP